MLSFILIVAILAALIAASFRANNNKNKVSQYGPKSGGHIVYHVSGLPVAEGTEMYLYDCGDRILISNQNNDFTIAKDKITGADCAPAKGFNLFWTLTIWFNSDGAAKSVAVNGSQQLEKIKRTIDTECATNRTLDL